MTGTPSTPRALQGFVPTCGRMAARNRTCTVKTIRSTADVVTDNNLDNLAVRRPVIPRPLRSTEDSGEAPGALFGAIPIRPRVAGVTDTQPRRRGGRRTQ